MAGRELAREELAAADIVAGALGGHWESRDGKGRCRRDDDAMLPILEAFEKQGRIEVDPHFNYAYLSQRAETPAPVVEAARRMVELGVTRARALAPRVEGDAEMFITINGGFAGDSDAVNRLVVERAEPKRDKLARAKAEGADECHLFVWLDGTQPGAELAVATMASPAAPEIPSEIDVVWLATPPLATPDKLWRARQPAGWEVLR